jgi:hypothetical protein
LLGGVGIALADDDLYISDVLFITSAVLMFLTSVAFAITIKVFVSHHPGTSKGDMQLTELTDQSQSLGADSEVENGTQRGNYQNVLILTFRKSIEVKNCLIQGQ